MRRVVAMRAQGMWPRGGLVMLKAHAAFVAATCLAQMFLSANISQHSYDNSSRASIVDL
jgi:hypothetical protein